MVKKEKIRIAIIVTLAAVIVLAVAAAVIIPFTPLYWNRTETAIADSSDHMGEGRLLNYYFPRYIFVAKSLSEDDFYKLHNMAATPIIEFYRENGYINYGNQNGKHIVPQVERISTGYKTIKYRITDSERGAEWIVTLCSKKGKESCHVEKVKELEYKAEGLNVLNEWLKTDNISAQLHRGKTFYERMASDTDLKRYEDITITDLHWIKEIASSVETASLTAIDAPENVSEDEMMECLIKCGDEEILIRAWKDKVQIGTKWYETNSMPQKSIEIAFGEEERNSANSQG